MSAERAPLLPDCQNIYQGSKLSYYQSADVYSFNKVTSVVAQKPHIQGIYWFILCLLFGHL